MITSVRTSVRQRFRASPMRATALAPRWWMMATRGALALAFGGTLSLTPDPTLPFVAVLFAGYAILDGAWAIGAAASISQHGRRLEPWPVTLEGAVSVLIGAAVLGWPAVPYAFVQMVALWGLVTGALELLTSFAMPRERAAHWLMGTGGACSISLAVLLMLIPGADAASTVYLIASYAIVFGVLAMTGAVQLRDDMSRPPRSRVPKPPWPQRR